MKTTPFWYSNKRGGIEINERQLIKFLDQIGFACYYLTQDKTVEPLYVYKTGNIVEPIIPLRIHEEAISILESGIFDENILPIKVIGDIVNKLIKTKSIEKKEVLTLLPEMGNSLISDTKDSAFFFYRNTAVRVSREGIRLLPLETFKCFVWKSQIIDRDFVLRNYKEVEERSEYYNFLRNVSRVEKNEKLEFDEDRFHNLMTLQGYMLHGYKNKANARAVILMDSSDKDEPNGRTGKGLIVDGISKIRKTVKEDGKSFLEDNRFKFSLVTPDTKILFIDDVKVNFNFENFFSAISEGITAERKFFDKFSISFDKSPKVVISTNYAVQGKGASSDARRYEFELSNYYSEEHTPVDDFHHLFFDEWDSDQWSLFDSLMMYLVQDYLGKGVTKSEGINLKRNKLIAETSRQFYDWITTYDIKPNLRYDKKILFKDYHSFNGNSFLSMISQEYFTKYLKIWAHHINLNPIETRSDANRYIEFKSE